MGKNYFPLYRVKLVGSISILIGVVTSCLVLAVAVHVTYLRLRQKNYRLWTTSMKHGLRASTSQSQRAPLLHNYRLLFHRSTLGAGLQSVLENELFLRIGWASIIWTRDLQDQRRKRHPSFTNKEIYRLTLVFLLDDCK